MIPQENTGGLLSGLHSETLCNRRMSMQEFVKTHFTLSPTVGLLMSKVFFFFLQWLKTGRVKRERGFAGVVLLLSDIRLLTARGDGRPEGEKASNSKPHLRSPQAPFVWVKSPNKLTAAFIPSSDFLFQITRVTCFIR